MPTAVLPPMTTKQAKKLGKKSAGQFRYTASQMRRADRREELEERRRKDEEKERKKKSNKRKREEDAEIEREAKRRLLKEGKIALEETWAAVSASQPRLNDFFRKPTVSTRLRPRSTPIESSRQESTQSHKAKSQSHKSQDVVPVAGNVTGSVTASQPDPSIEDLSDSELLDLLPSQHSLHQNSHPTPPDSLEQEARSSTSLHKPDKPHSSQMKRASLHNKQSRPKKSTHKMPRRARNTSPEPHDPCVEDQAVEMDEYSEKIEVAEDETADADVSLLMAQQQNESFSSDRSVLSNMTIGQVNIRAADKPDTTSVSKDDIGLLTPSKQTVATSKSRGSPLRSEVPGSPDFSDAEDNDENWDKENTDPIQTPAKKLKMSDKPSSACGVPDKTPFKSSLQKAARGTPKPSSLQDIDDMLDIDFETGNDDEFSDDELDDQSFAAIAATQKPRSDKIIDPQGSPRKLTSSRDAMVQSAPLKFHPKTAMAPPPSKSVFARLKDQTMKQSTGINKSLSFSSVNDDDLLDFADQVEEELSQKSAKGKGKEFVPREQLPNTTVMPPMSTQAFMLQMVDEDEDEI